MARKLASFVDVLGTAVSVAAAGKLLPCCLVHSVCHNLPTLRFVSGLRGLPDLLQLGTFTMAQVGLESHLLVLEPQQSAAMISVQVAFLMI